MVSELEIRVLIAFAAQPDLVAPDTLVKAIHTVTRTGSYIRRSRALPPGTRVMREGCTTLAGMCLGFAFAMEQKVSSIRPPQFHPGDLRGVGRANRYGR